MCFRFYSNNLRFTVLSVSMATEQEGSPPPQNKHRRREVLNKSGTFRVQGSGSLKEPESRSVCLEPNSIKKDSETSRRVQRLQLTSSSGYHGDFVMKGRGHAGAELSATDHFSGIKT